MKTELDEVKALLIQMQSHQSLFNAEVLGTFGRLAADGEISFDQLRNMKDGLDNMMGISRKILGALERGEIDDDDVLELDDELLLQDDY